MSDIIKNEERLFVISNTTHYLNLRTYIETHEKGKNWVIFFNRFSPGYEELIEKLKADDDVVLMEIIDHEKNKRFPDTYLNLLSIIQKVKSLRKQRQFFDKIFFSNYLSWVQHFIIKQFEANQIILLNDGTAIFETVALRQKAKKIEFPEINPLVNRFLASNEIDSLQFYSPINIEVAEYDSLELFNFPASETNYINENLIYFVGGPLVNLGYIELEDHLSYLHRIKKKFPNHKILYFAHRGEKERHLEQYKFFGEIIRDTMTFEERLNTEGELPGRVISYVSSILINLPQVYPQILFNYFELEVDKIPESSKFRKIYPPLLNNFRNIKNRNFGSFSIQQGGEINFGSPLKRNSK